MRLKHLTLQRFRGVEDLELTFPATGPLVLLGENGAGKSSVITAICYALLGEVLPSSGHRSAWNVHRDHPDAQVVLRTTDGTGTVRLSRKGTLEVVEGANDFPNELLWTDSSPALFLAGYGATRRVDAGESYDPDVRNRSTGRRLQRVGSLLEQSFALVPLESWTSSGKSEGSVDIDALSAVFEQATTGEVKLTPDRSQDGQLLFDFRGSRLPLRALSDGYRAHIGWLADLLFHLHQLSAETPLRERAGVVLIDEVDLHLHPRWQRSVLQSLADALPAMQFVVTTHSPLVLGGVHAESVCVLRREDGRLTAARPGIETFGLSPDQLLLSDLFQLESTRPAQAQQRYEAAVESLKQLRRDADPDNPVDGL
ncbi:MAG: AAA family ATPase [Alphaproteobacteria bacterium]|nr:AAA family ATPase [Alphaproteobacteria bacterium]